MYPLHKRWQIQPPITQEAKVFLHEYPPILRQILFNRGQMLLNLREQFLKSGQDLP